MKGHQLAGRTGTKITVSTSPDFSLPCMQANGMYNESMGETWRNLTLLKLAGKRLQDDVKDKKTAADIDSSIVRLRRRRVNHRWVLDGTTIATDALKVKN